MPGKILPRYPNLVNGRVLTYTYATAAQHDSRTAGQQDNMHMRDRKMLWEETKTI